MKKHLFLKSFLVLIGVLITSLTTQTWADNYVWGHLYFNNTSKNWSYVSFIVGTDDNSIAYYFGDNPVSNTNLYYREVHYKSGGGVAYKDLYFFNEKWNSGYDSEANQKPYDRISNKTYWQPAKWSYNDNKTWYFDGSTQQENIPTREAWSAVKTRSFGTTYSTASSAWPATIGIKGTHMTGNGTTGRNDISSNSGDSDEANRKYKAVITGKITHTYSLLSSDYYFEGWGTGDSPSNTNSSYEYSIQENTTVYAFFSHLYSLVFGVKGTPGTSTLAVNVANYDDIASGDKVPTGHTITASATIATGYEVSGWYRDADCTSAYTNGSGGVTISGTGNKNFSITSLNSNSGIYPKFVELKTVSVAKNGSGGSVSTSSVKAGASTASTTITATPANIAWRFKNWTIPAGVTIASGSATSASITIKATADSQTITANFEPRYGLVGSRQDGTTADGMPLWTDASAPDFVVTSFTDKDHMSMTCIRTLQANKDYKFQVYDRESNCRRGGDSDATMTLGTNWKLTGSGNVLFNTKGAGSYTFEITKIDGSNYQPSIQINAVPSYTITFGHGTGGSTVTASGSVSGSITTGQYVASGENVTFTQTAAAGYTFKEWNTQADGNGTQLGTGASLTLSSIGENKNVYAIYTPNVYRITFDYQNAGAERGDGDRFSDVGSTLVDGSGNRYINVTYNEIVSGTMPKAEKDGYVFGGWYVDQDATDKKPIDENGSWRTITGYTDTDKKWIHAGDVTLYARFWAPSFLSISFSPAHAEPQADVTATISFNPFLSHPGPEGNYTLCYTLTTAAGVALRAQPEWRDKDDATYTVTFKAPSSPGDYSLLVKLFAGTGDVCGGNSPVATFQGGPDLYKFDVEDMNPVTVTYECGGVELLPSTTVYATWNNRAHITPPSIAGMKFDHWEYTNCTIVGGSDGRYNEPEAEIYAFTAGSVKAVYTQGSLFFKNTKNWDHVYVYFYRSNYWYTKVSSGESEGTGSNNSWAKGANKVISGPLEMTLLEGTDDVFFYDGEVGENYAAVAFSDESMPNYDYFSKGGTPCQVVYVNTFDANKPMIVPVGNGAVWNNGTCKYYAHDLAPLLADWGYDLRGDNDIIGWSPATDADKHKFKAPKMGDLNFSTTIYIDDVYEEKEWKIYNGNKGYGRSDHQKLTASSPTSGVLTNYDASGYNMKIQSNTPGEYTFTLTFNTDGGSGSGEANYGGPTTTDGLLNHMTVTIDYPVVVGDFRLFYDDKDHPGNVIKKRANGVDVVDMFVESGHASDIKVQTCTAVSNSAVTWGSLSAANYDGVDFSDILSEGGSGVYSFTITQNEAGTSYAITNVEKYAGRFYVRTNCVNGDKWNYKDSKDAHAMIYSDYSTTLTDKPYSHYYVKDVDGSSSSVNIRFTVATDYSEAITDTVFNGDAAGAYKDMWGNETLTQKMNVRFTYNQKTNKIWRAYTEGPQLTGYMTLRAKPSAASIPYIYKSNAGVIGAHQDTLKFVDMGNWVYQLDAYGDPGVYVKLTANIRNSSGEEIMQYLKGKDNATYDESNAVLLIGGSGEAQHMRITYDFKTERMTTAWLPSGPVTSDLSIHADVMLLRKHQQGATSIVIGKKDASNYAQLSDVEKAYGVMEFEKSYINNTSLSRYERNLYWISFPFNVKLSDVFGFGKYGQHWIIEYYDGKGRAQKGYWADSEPNWKYVTEEVKDEFELKANEGYILALALSNMGDGSSIWEGGKISSVYLYFPSKDNIGNITNVEGYNMPLDSVGYKCNITRDHRNVKDSYWHCIGVPSFALNSLTGVSTTVPGDGEDWSTPLPYVYKWDSVYNTLSIASTSTFKFEAMKSYLIQYANDHISWANVTNKASVVARRRVEGNNASFYEWNLNLLSNGQHIDHTYVRLSNDENVTDGYDFGNDLSKEFNSGSNIYTFVDDVEVAGNVKPIRTETTIVPVGVKIATTGEYTFSMPEGTNGVGVILVDNIAGTRTNLALEDYTINLEAGQYDGRFLLEISPIAQTPTDMENVQGDDVQTNVRKVMVDGILYIVKDGVIYDARGNRVK